MRNVPRRERVDVVGILALVVSVLLWLFNPHPIRTRLGLEPKPEPEPHYVLRADVTGHPVLGPVWSENRGGLEWVPAGLESAKVAAGYRRWRDPEGRVAVLQQYHGRQTMESVLMWRPGRGHA